MRLILTQLETFILNYLLLSAAELYLQRTSRLREASLMAPSELSAISSRNRTWTGDENLRLLYWSNSINIMA